MHRVLQPSDLVVVEKKKSEAGQMIEGPCMRDQGGFYLGTCFLNAVCGLKYFMSSTEICQQRAGTAATSINGVCPPKSTSKTECEK